MFVMLLGCGIRLRHLLAERSLYIDEARLALNIGSRSVVELARPLDLEQLAPVPFLWAIKGVSELLGMGEVALRLVPFLAGVLFLPVLWAAARALLPSRAALLALIFGALSPALVVASVDLKPYVVDALVAALLLWLAARALRSPERSSTRWILYLSSAAGTVVSLTGIICATAGLSALCMRFSRGNRKVAIEAALVLVACGVLAALAVRMTYGAVGHSAYMNQFWSSAFLLGHSERGLFNGFLLAGDFAWGMLVGKLAHGQDPTGVAIAYAVAGSALMVWLAAAASHARKLWGWSLAWACCGPFVLLVMLNLLHVYPMRVRVVLCLWPGACVLMATGVHQAIAMRHSFLARSLVWMCCAMVVGIMGLASGIKRFWPYSWRELGPVVRELDALPEGLPTYVNAGAGPVWLFYTTDWPLGDSARFSWYMERIKVGAEGFENADAAPTGPGLALRLRFGTDGVEELLGRSTGQQFRPYERPLGEPLPRAWIAGELGRMMAARGDSIVLVFANERRAENGLLDALDAAGGSQLAHISAPGAHAFVYDLSRASIPAQ